MRHFISSDCVPHRSIRSALLARVFELIRDSMTPEPYELFDINKGADKLFLIGTSWVVLFLFLL
ncbi:hypothetical protein KR100_09430 [Synechococcus sp. KORDI-100]|nr:hypothetical protein KR100_09430 [Synechococcus sp. KORDI-100]